MFINKINNIDFIDQSYSQKKHLLLLFASIFILKLYVSYQYSETELPNTSLLKDASIDFLAWPSDCLDIRGQKETGSAVSIGARLQICTATDFSLIMGIGFQ